MTDLDRIPKLSFAQVRANRYGLSLLRQLPIDRANIRQRFSPDSFSLQESFESFARRVRFELAFAGGMFGVETFAPGFADVLIEELFNALDHARIVFTDLFGHFDRCIAQLCARDDLIEQANAFRFVSLDRPSGVEQLLGLR